MKNHATHLFSRAFAASTLGLVLLLLVVLAAWKWKTHKAEVMVEVASKFLSSLSEGQKGEAFFGFEDNKRFDWHYLPDNLPRNGLALKKMTANQKELAEQLLRTGLSDQGYLKAQAIIGLEKILKALEGWELRDPELYHLAIFGKPSLTEPWAWKVEGHHLSLNFTIINGEVVATTPRFMGTNPAEVKAGPHQGLRVLAEEEDLARQLLHSFDQEQKAQVIFSPLAFKDIVTAYAAEVGPLENVGIAAAEMRGSQKQILEEVIHLYLSSMPEKIAEHRFSRIVDEGFEKIYFGWAGGTERGDAHYYRIQGPSFLVEYDNVQNKANHQHTVWRDFEGDFGRDLLREHYEIAPVH